MNEVNLSQNTTSREMVIEVVCSKYAAGVHEWEALGRIRIVGGFLGGVQAELDCLDAWLTVIEEQLQGWGFAEWDNQTHFRNVVRGIISYRPSVTIPFLRMSAMLSLYRHEIPPVEEMFGWLNFNDHLATKLVAQVRQGVGDRRVVADALEEAGCHHEPLLTHLRTCQHTSSVTPVETKHSWCWATDYLTFVLGEYEHRTSKRWGLTREQLDVLVTK